MYEQVLDIMTGLASEYVIRREDGVFIPVDSDNGDYKAYLAWLAEGNTIKLLDGAD